MTRTSLRQSASSRGCHATGRRGAWCWNGGFCARPDELGGAPPSLRTSSDPMTDAGIVQAEHRPGPSVGDAQVF
ncbi:hypothetical protein AB0F17_54095 [Nonomuraea sp. NPDC026600]|uniref:hypothetical protein n=1 Tax=Nonomuraea sp. NPDC026600 TaxID=3155363 RepID=UPI0033ED2134